MSPSPPPRTLAAPVEASENGSPILPLARETGKDNEEQEEEGWRPFQRVIPGLSGRRGTASGRVVEVCFDVGCVSRRA